ncbi:MAG: WecB/TagA/CpsF family glycosyltransferase [Candidatus Aminicenantia bacterium]
MIDKKKEVSNFVIEGIEINNLTMKEALERMRESLEKKEKGFIVTPNASHIVELRRDKDFFEAYRNATLILPDGFSLILASRFLKEPIKERCTGADLFPEVCKMASVLGKRVFIMGGKDGGERIIEEKVRKSFPGIEIQVYSPPFRFEKNELITNEIIERINNFKTDILFVCVGTPKSEKWIFKNFGRMNVNLAFSVGSAPEFFAGIKRRAPKWMQNMGLEWFWRLIQEPKRLWKRYLIGNTIFLWLVFREFLKIHLWKKIKKG